MVTIDNLSHRYSKAWAIKDISFNIEKNGIVGLLGSNGAGKSTTMNILCGIIAPTQGKVMIGEYNIIENPIEAKKLMGFLPQKPPLYQDLTVDEYLYHCGRLRMISKKSLKPAVEKVKEYCGIAEFSKRLIGNLSGGYQQRVGIAQAIIHRPRLVVLDEPTNGLDPVQITEIRSLVRDISRDSAVLLSTHILSEVQAVCDEIIMIEKGHVVFSGSMNKFNGLIKPNTIMVRMGNIPHLDEIDAIEGVKLAKQIEPGYLRLEIGENANVAETIVELSVKNGWQLSEIHNVKTSLDSIFAKLSNRELKA